MKTKQGLPASTKIVDKQRLTNSFNKQDASVGRIVDLEPSLALTTKRTGSIERPSYSFMFGKNQFDSQVLSGGISNWGNFKKGRVELLEILLSL